MGEPAAVGIGTLAAMVDAPVGAGPPSPPPSRRGNPALARVVAVVVIVGAVVTLVVQNSQRVAIRFWFFTGHVRLIWVIVVCLVVAGGLGYVLGRRGRRRRRRRPVSQ